MRNFGTLADRCIIRPAVALALLAPVTGAAGKGTESYKEKVLYSFCSQHKCADGGAPIAGLIADAQGNLYGTTESDGANGGGTVFEVTPEGQETVLYSFCSQRKCADGFLPYAGLIADAQGNLYGTTQMGGADGKGSMFEVTQTGKETVLHSFKGGSADGANPLAGLFADSQGNLYGTTVEGGPYCTGSGGCGTVFEVTLKGKETVLYNFCAQGGSNCSDGATPFAGLIADGQGNFYGTTGGGGANGGGTVFEVTSKGQETVLYSFCAQGGCTDGAQPEAGLIRDTQGNLYGTTQMGGANARCNDGNSGCGTVFEVTPQGKEAVLYSFCARAKCIDGSSPSATLIDDAQGNLYSTTLDGGLNNSGTVFELEKKK